MSEKAFRKNFSVAIICLSSALNSIKGANRQLPDYSPWFDWCDWAEPAELEAMRSTLKEIKDLVSQVKVYIKKAPM